MKAFFVGNLREVVRLQVRQGTLNTMYYNIQLSPTELMVCAGKINVLAMTTLLIISNWKLSYV